jgi:hypothetical protein
MVMAVHHALDGQRVWWVAPTYHLAFHPWRTFKRRLAAEWVSKSEYDRHIELPGGGSITVKTADNPDGLRGVGLDLLIVDEAAFIAEEAWVAALRPSLSDRNGSALIISTPRGRNWFFHAFMRGRDPSNGLWQSWQHPTAENHAIAPAELDEARTLLPQRIFEQEYEAQFLPDGGTVFRSVRGAILPGAPAGPLPGHRYLMGVDFGRAFDFTALAVLDASASHDGLPRPRLVALERFSEVSWRLQRARIARLARAWGVRAVLAEANAIGEPNVEALLAEGVPVSGFTTTALTKPPLIESLVRAIEDCEIALLDHPVLIAELEAYTYSANPYTGRYRYSAPAGQHDDTVIALALAWHLAATPRLVFGIAVV